VLYRRRLVLQLLVTILRNHSFPYFNSVKHDPRYFWQPGRLKRVQAIGWTVEEHGLAQVSCNISDCTVTKLHEVFEEVCKDATVSDDFQDNLESSAARCRFSPGMPRDRRLHVAD